MEQPEQSPSGGVNPPTKPQPKSAKSANQAFLWVLLGCLWALSYTVMAYDTPSWRENSTHGMMRQTLVGFQQGLGDLNRQLRDEYRQDFGGFGFLSRVGENLTAPYLLSRAGGGLERVASAHPLYVNAGTALDALLLGSLIALLLVGWWYAAAEDHGPQTQRALLAAGFVGQGVFWASYLFIRSQVNFNALASTLAASDSLWMLPLALLNGLLHLGIEVGGFFSDWLLAKFASIGHGEQGYQVGMELALTSNTLLVIEKLLDLRALVTLALLTLVVPPIQAAATVLALRRARVQFPTAEIVRMTLMPLVMSLLVLVLAYWAGSTVQGFKL